MRLAHVSEMYTIESRQQQSPQGSEAMLNSDEAKHKETEAMLNAYFYIAQNFCFVQIETNHMKLNLNRLVKQQTGQKKII